MRSSSAEGIPGLLGARPAVSAPEWPSEGETGTRDPSVQGTQRGRALGQRQVPRKAVLTPQHGFGSFCPTPSPAYEAGLLPTWLVSGFRKVISLLAASASLSIKSGDYIQLRMVTRSHLIIKVD